MIWSHIYQIAHDYCSHNHSALKTFEGIEVKTVALRNVTVLVGDNATGKTALLEALVSSLCPFVAALTGKPQEILKASDVRVVRKDIGGIPDSQKPEPIEIVTRVEFQGISFEWLRKLSIVDSKPVDVKDNTLFKSAEGLKDAVGHHQTVPLPVICYYGTQRLWQPHLPAAAQWSESLQRQDGYRDCLHAASTHELMLNWMRRLTYAEIQEQNKSPQLQAIQRAVTACISLATQFRFSIKYDELQIVTANDELIRFTELSDGYRNIVAIVADIAWRASILNPHFGALAPTLTEGIVVIDEIDLHLHPRWQRRILSDLRTTFPRIQFITTTHSPFIVQSLQAGEFVILDPENLESEPTEIEPNKLSPEDITERILGVELPQRSWRRENEAKVAEEYFQLLDSAPAANRAEIENLKSQLDKLLAPYHDNQAFVALLERERIKAQGRFQ
jgi:predicted ATP-binding protein involved in virulence